MKTTIGQKIKEVFDTSGLKPAHVTKLMHTSLRSVYYDFEKDTIPTDRLSQWCKVLNYNFFEWIMQEEGLQTAVREPQASYDRRQPMKISLLIELDTDAERHLMKREIIQRLTNALK